MLEVREMCAGYGGVDVIRNISFSVVAGESLCVLGPNGCGKTTLLKSIARIIDYRGTVSLKDRDILSFSRKELAKKIALLGQSAKVYFPYTVYETVSMGRYAHSGGFLKGQPAEDKTIVEDIIEKLDIKDIKDKMIDELSGGQLQRVFLAKTFAQTPDIILLDEPANHLDLKYQIELLDFLKSWVRDNNKTLISVLHDLNLARRFADTAIVMKDGEITACGKIENALNGEILQAVYGLDIHAHMLESLEQWRIISP
ncbi:MAG: ABC transporter ATP-binding protein [Treponema sp.]|nr:ABC transporter ATP-binding protein [Treponema sp.]